ncbi:transcriptional regulator with XRE-family HTH domain [Variovorax boronicumulans]|uniref:Transcriptional regulator with XRE-family HTH domain n=1 Tax=Variovorax boronicumulans TaxID=436515 RepID=A0AAW8D7C7_9BURK|nr:transcriptional regulator with XRE-family HTH domain [Variovorax boronicumulans]MDQ0036100.1 transcriptional regulator with XRE-family HTH domain [Variovorax boronicumulans]MDQ0055586.1 transcriptional regulator with XRE-family HTH domain [Variovorax boronicumulans]
MATLSVIRRWALREQMSIREIVRRTGLSRNTVKKYLRAGDEEPRYAKRASSSKLDPYAEKLATWLAIEATKSRKQRRNLRQIHTLLELTQFLNASRWTSCCSWRHRSLRVRSGIGFFQGLLGQGNAAEKATGAEQAAFRFAYVRFGSTTTSSNCSS